MSQRSKRRSILLESEISDLYSPPVFSIEQKRFFFALNDVEAVEIDSIIDR